MTPIELAAEAIYEAMLGGDVTVAGDLLHKAMVSTQDPPIADRNFAP
jgi:hypothetical protein